MLIIIISEPYKLTKVNHITVYRFIYFTIGHTQPTTTGRYLLRFTLRHLKKYAKTEVATSKIK